MISINIVKDGALIDASAVAVYDEDFKKITITCFDEHQVGGKKIRVTYTFQDYVFGWSYTTEFNVLIKPMPG